MNVKEFYSEEPVTVAEVKKLLTAISKERELEYVQKKALEHAQHGAKVSFKDATAMVNELVELGLTKEKAIEIVNSMPADRDELRAFFSKERKQPETDEVDKVLGVLAKYR
jgi:DNA-directed RNA polymerase subunit F